MIYFKIPTQQDLDDFLKKESQENFTYSPVHGTTSVEKIVHYDNDCLEKIIGHGEKDFEKAKRAIQNWQMFPSSWTKILPENTPIQVGVNIVMMARFLGLWWRNSCKIVYIINESKRFGFAYGTLPGHIESGEELFLVEWLENNDVRYTIKAFSRPYHIFARLGYPMIRILQERFRQDSAAQMKGLM